MGVTTMGRRAMLLGIASALGLPLTGALGASGLNSLSLILGTQPTSTLDTVGRAFAELGRREGSVAITVQNLEGASSQLAFKDALSHEGNGGLLYFLQGALLYLSLSDNAESADLVSGMPRINLIGSFGADRRIVFVATRTGIKDFDGLLASKEPLVTPSVTANSGSYLEALAINYLTGSRLKPVGGYSSSERKLAIMSGEANAAVGSADTYGDLVEQGVLTPVLRINDTGPDGPHADRPLLSSVSKGDDAKVLNDLLAGVADTNNIVIAPPGLSDDQVSALSGYFDLIAPQLATMDKSGVEPAEAVAFSRKDVLAHVGQLFSDRAAVAAAFNRSQACGQILADGGACS